MEGKAHFMFLHSQSDCSILFYAGQLVKSIQINRMAGRFFDSCIVKLVIIIQEGGLSYGTRRFLQKAGTAKNK